VIRNSYQADNELARTSIEHVAIRIIDRHLARLGSEGQRKSDQGRLAMTSFSNLRENPVRRQGGNTSDGIPFT
jgi:hypothetical protein